jgi:aromatic ring hydroxylase-like protein
VKIVDIRSADVRDLYEAPLALVRPDQVVAWRGADDARADAVAATVLGR